MRTYWSSARTASRDTPDPHWAPLRTESPCAQPVRSVSSRALTERPRLIVVGVEEGRPDALAIDRYADAAGAATGAHLKRVDVSDQSEATSALLAAASGADLVVLGARRTDEPFSTRLGGVTAGVLPLAECPVVLVATSNDPTGA